MNTDQIGLFLTLKIQKLARLWWCTPLIPVFERQGYLSELEASQIYKVSSRKARTVTQRKNTLKEKKKKKEKKLLRL